MARNGYASFNQEHLLKQPESVPHLIQALMQQVPTLTYFGISKFMMDKWIPLRQQMSSQFQADVRAVLSEQYDAYAEISTKLSSIEQSLALGLPGRDAADGSIDRLRSEMESLNTNLGSLAGNINGHLCDQGSSFASLRLKMEGLIENVQLQTEGQDNNHHRMYQPPDQEMLDMVVNTLLEELRQGGATGLNVRCVCGGVAEPKRPNTRRQKGQRRFLVFCDDCDAWHHGTCVGMEAPKSFSCTRGQKLAKQS